MSIGLQDSTVSQTIKALSEEEGVNTIESEQPKDTRRQEAYVTSLEHLQDELKRLDLLIHLRVIQQRDRQPASTFDQFRGLVLWDEEIDRLLNADIVPAANEAELSPSDAELQQLTLRLDQLESQIQERRAESAAQGISLELANISRLFKLNSFEEHCVLICLAPEVDRKYERLFAYLQDDVTRKKPSVDLILNLLCSGVEEKIHARIAFDWQAPLFKHRLLQLIDDPLDPPAPMIARAVKLDDRIAASLLGYRSIDARLEPVARLVVFDEGVREGLDTETQQKLRDVLDAHFAAAHASNANAALHFYGPYGSGKREMAEALSNDLGLSLIVADAERMIDGALPFDEAARLLARECELQPAALAIENFDCLVSESGNRRSQLGSLLELIRSIPRLTFLLANKSWMPPGLSNELLFVSRRFLVPDARTRQQIMKSDLAGYAHLLSDDDLGLVAGKFRFTRGQIQDAVVAAHDLAAWRSPQSPEITSSDLYAACRARSTTRLGDLARKVEPHYKWKDIVLPADQLAQLKEICDQVKTRRIVYGDWGFDRKLSLGRGLNALFSGPPGTGKTMAAEVVASELGLELYRIDLSQVVSKYIGETEKNLSQIFAEAQSSNAILFFDEADALFGKRSEVKDSHDRYANIEIGYLLQEMEEYDGIAILATNLRQNMDEAFVRRLQIIVEFPFPDQEHRELIWQVTFPTEAPIDDGLDFGFLAREIKLAGGNIKNIALTAAFYAASDGGSIGMVHLEEATRREYQKLGWHWTEGDWNKQSPFVS